jgi:hypothetical protein
MKYVRLLVLSGALLLSAAPAALADWDHEVKWDQLEPYVATMFDMQPTYISNVMQIVADDFECSETGYITDIEFYGNCPNLDSLNEFRITFWSDCASAAGRPGTLIEDLTVAPADGSGTGWQIIDQGTNSYLFKINLPVEDWFVQEEGSIYWIGIQGVLSGDDKFMWCSRAFGAETMLDDAVIAKDVLIPSPGDWDELVWADTLLGLVVASEASIIELGYTPIQSADMSFRLTGTPIPEPTLVVLLAIAGVAILRRRRR